MMAKRKGRANGEGSIYEYPKGSGKWMAQLSLEDGRAVRRRACSQREAREKLKQLQTAHAQGVDLALQQPTVSQWCQTWLNNFTINLKPNVREDYQGVIRRYIDDDPIGRKRLHQLTSVDAQAWINRLSLALAPQTVHNAHARLHKALAVAVRQRYIVRNLADDLELPSVRTPPIKPFDLNQVQCLLKALVGHRWYALYRLAVNLGMRQGELLGLTREHIDLEAGIIRIRQQLQRETQDDETRSFVLQTTKTQAGERTLQIDQSLTKILREHLRNLDEEQALHGKAWKDTLNLIFVTETGAPIHGSDLLQHFNRVLKRAKLPKIRFHDLRHTAATLMLADGIPLVTVSKILGHSSPAVTAKIYAHALDESKSIAIAGLSQKLEQLNERITHTSTHSEP
jgi:integrase